MRNKAKKKTLKEIANSDNQVSQKKKKKTHRLNYF